MDNPAAVPFQHYIEPVAKPHRKGHKGVPTAAKVAAQKAERAGVPDRPETAFDRFQTRRKQIETRLQKQTYKEQMIARISSRLDALHEYLQDDETWWEKLEEAKLRDIAIFEGVYTDKLRDLMGHSTPVVTVQHQQKVDQLLPALLQIMQQRGLTVTATERKVEMKA